MRAFITTFAVATLFVAAPAFAADAAKPATPAKPAQVAAPAAAPVPPAVTYQVWGFQWNGATWVRQPSYTLQTTDLKQAATYKSQINGFANWRATTNLPAASYVHTRFHGNVNSRPTQSPATPTYSVWAFTLTNGKWVKSDQYSWTTTDPAVGLAYVNRVDSVPGWTATTNCPPTVPQAQRFVDGGNVQGTIVTAPQNGMMTFNLGGVSITVPYSYLQRAGVGAGSYTTSNDDNSDNWPTNDTSQVDQNNALQDMLNQQQELNNEQDLINEQNFNDTENMINNEQETINAQQMANPNP